MIYTLYKELDFFLMHLHTSNINNNYVVGAENYDMYSWYFISEIPF